MRGLVLALNLAAGSCYPHTGSPLSGPETFNCPGVSEARLESVLDYAGELLGPGVASIADRTDWFCGDSEYIHRHCAPYLTDAEAASAQIECCTAWLYPNARVYVLESTGPEACATHEPQHWGLWADLETNACQSHTAACGWDWAVVEALQSRLEP